MCFGGGNDSSSSGNNNNDRPMQGPTRDGRSLQQAINEDGNDWNADGWHNQNDQDYYDNNRAEAEQRMRDLEESQRRAPAPPPPAPAPSPDPISQALGGDARSFVSRAMPEPAKPADRPGAKSAPAAAAPAGLAAIPGVGSVPLPPTRPDRMARENRRARGVAEGVIGLPDLNAPAVTQNGGLAPYQGPMPDGSIVPAAQSFSEIGDRELALVAAGVGLPRAGGGYLTPQEDAMVEAGYELVARGHNSYDSIANLWGDQEGPGRQVGERVANRMASVVDALDQDNRMVDDVAETVATNVIPFANVPYEYHGGPIGFDALVAGEMPEAAAAYGFDPVAGITSIAGLAGAPRAATAAMGLVNRMGGRPFGIETDRTAVLGTADPVGMPNADNWFNARRNQRDDVRGYFGFEDPVKPSADGRRSAASRSWNNGDDSGSDSDGGSYNEPAPSYGSNEPAPAAPPPALEAPPPEPALRPPSSWKRWAGAPHPERTGESRNINAFGYEDEFFATGPGGYLPYRGYLDPAHPVNTEETKWYRDQGIASLYGMHPEHYFYPNQRGPMA